jgi:hypothetical protein
MKKVVLVLFIATFLAQLDYFLMNFLLQDIKLYNPFHLIGIINWAAKAGVMGLVLYYSLTLAKKSGDAYIGTTFLASVYLPTIFATSTHVAFFSKSGNFFQNIETMMKNVTMTPRAMVAHFLIGAIFVFITFFLTEYIDTSKKKDKGEIAPILEE